MIAIPGVGRLRVTLIHWKNKEFGVSGDLAEIFSRKQRIGGIGAAPIQRRITADAGECGALAAEFGLPAIAGLTGDFTLLAARGQTGSFIDAKNANWSMMISPNSTFSTAAAQAINQALQAASSSVGTSPLAQYVSPQAAPEPTTVLAWGLGLLALAAGRRLQGRRHPAG